MTSIGLSRAGWRKSSYSTANSECVEICFPGEIVAARDSKNAGGPVLVFEPACWSVFLRGLAVG